MWIYLEKKARMLHLQTYTARSACGRFWMHSQRYGIRMKNLYKLNAGWRIYTPQEWWYTALALKQENKVTKQLYV